MTSLQNKTALVTGASRGIGRATAMVLAEAGAHVLVHYGRSVEEAESLVTAIRAKRGRANAIAADLGTPDGASLLAKQVRYIAGDRLDVLVLNAGVSKSARIADHTVEDFDRLFATNVRGPFFLVQQLLTILGEGSSIVVVSSAAARIVPGKPGLETPSILAYASTKGALETLVKHWAAILGPSGIRVNAVAPGIIDTDMSNFTKTEAGRETALGMQALERLGKPDLEYKQLPYDLVEQALTQMGIMPKGAAMYVEMYKAINKGVLVPLEPRSQENTTATSFETFVQDVFVPEYQQNK
jgi:3-oxoacyl-[acyl-carrier protein] reductase